VALHHQNVELEEDPKGLGFHLGEGQKTNCSYERFHLNESVKKIHKILIHETAGDLNQTQLFNRSEVLQTPSVNQNSQIN